MKLNTPVTCLLFVCALTTCALAEANFDLKEPQLAFPADFPESDRTNIMASLSRADCEFVGGSSVNSFTSLKYSGDTRALNLFLEGLVKRPGVVLSVRLHTEPAWNDCGWIVAHVASEPRRFAVHVNLKASQIRPDDLVIPESKGPPLAESNK